MAMDIATANKEQHPCKDIANAPPPSLLEQQQKLALMASSFIFLMPTSTRFDIQVLAFSEAYAMLSNCHGDCYRTIFFFLFEEVTLVFSVHLKTVSNRSQETLTLNSIVYFIHKKILPYSQRRSNPCAPQRQSVEQHYIQHILYEEEPSIKKRLQK